MLRLLILGVMSALLGSGPVFAGTYNCTAVDKKASVGVSSNDSVTISTGNKTCSFSVNGNSVDSKTMAEARTGLNLLATSAANDITLQLAALLFSPLEASPDNLKGLLVQKLSHYRSDIDSCLRAFQSQSSFSFGVFGSDVFCSFVRSSAPLQIGPITYTLEIPHMQFGAKLDGDLSSVAIIPITFMRRRLPP